MAEARIKEVSEELTELLALQFETKALRGGGKFLTIVMF